jgi:hypothetical protein
MAGKKKTNKGSPNKDPLEKDPEQSESNVAAMLQGRGFEIIDNEKIKDTDGLSKET